MRFSYRFQIVLLAFGLVSGAAALPVAAEPISFHQVMVSAGDTDVAASLSGTVVDGGTIVVGGETFNTALFSFSVAANPAAPSMFIGGVFFDDGALLGIHEIYGGSGDNVDFDFASGTFPQGENLAPDFEPTAAFTINFDGGAPNGVQAGETLYVRFQLLSGYDVTHVVQALNQGLNLNPNVDADAQPLNLRIGLHIQALPTGEGSDSYINGPGGTPVPLPAVAWAGMALLGGVGLRRRSRASA